jgi:hypothetical protein
MCTTNTTTNKHAHPFWITFQQLQDDDDDDDDNGRLFFESR